MGRILVGLISAVFLLTGCSAATFSSKNEALAKSSVFGESGDESATDRLPAGANEDDISREIRVGNPDESQVYLMCSDQRSKKSTNFKKAMASGMPVKLFVGRTICSSDPTAILGLIAKKDGAVMLKNNKITRADLAAVCPGPLPPADSGLALNLVIGEEATTSHYGTLTILYARNADDSVPSEAADEHCDKKSSPLVIHMASDINKPQPIALSSQAEGVDFDLLGARHRHAKVRISWFTNLDYRFLSLPDARGEVRGIDQLFGDNTTGPDGQFAANGYAALAKFDLNSDGRIDERDPVFKKLRLWLDKNFDGVGQAREMTTLDQAKIRYIDLEFSSDYAETDRFGNETKMKSVVGYRDGSLDLIFDLWFSYNL